MYNMQDVILQFKNMRGSNGFAAKRLVGKLAATSDNNRRGDSLSHNLLKQRIDFIEQGTKAFFQTVDCNDVTITPMDNGAESLVLDCGEDYVVKIKRGQPYIKHNFSKLLQPVHSEYSQELDVNYEIVPKVHKQGARVDQVMGMIVKSAMKGFIINDPAKFNFGWVKQEDSEKEKMVIIDRGAVYKGRNFIHDMAYTGYAMVKAVGVPLYLSMPFLHEPWRNFKSNVKAMTSYKRASEYETALDRGDQPRL